MQMRSARTVVAALVPSAPLTVAVWSIGLRAYIPAALPARLAARPTVGEWLARTSRRPSQID